MSPTQRLINENVTETSPVTPSAGSGQAQVSTSPTTLSPRHVALIQGIYYLFTGIWPLVHMPSFEKVSGPKTDDWLVRTVGVLISAIGVVLFLAAARQRPLAEPEIPTLAFSSAAGLTAIDIIYVAKGRISPIYLLDALFEMILIAAWVLVQRNQLISLVARFGKSRHIFEGESPCTP